MGLHFIVQAHHNSSLCSLSVSLSSSLSFFFLVIISSTLPVSYRCCFLTILFSPCTVGFGNYLLAVAYRTQAETSLCWILHQGFKFKDDNTLLRHVNDTNRSIYAFELTEPPDAYTSVSDGGGDRPTEMDSCQRCTITGEEVPCMICLEELDGDLKRHSGNSCNFIMCDPCIEVRVYHAVQM